MDILVRWRQKQSTWATLHVKSDRSGYPSMHLLMHTPSIQNEDSSQRMFLCSHASVSRVQFSMSQIMGCKEIKMKIFIWSRRILWGLTMMSWRYPRYEAQHVVRDHEVLYVRHQSRRKPFLEQQPLVSEQDFHFGRNARWSSDSHYLVAAFLRLAAAENVHFGGRKIFYLPLSKKRAWNYALCGKLVLKCTGSIWNIFFHCWFCLSEVFLFCLAKTKLFHEITGTCTLNFTINQNGKGSPTKIERNVTLEFTWSEATTAFI